ncbi:anthranilate phosphoribosyltransferase [Rhodomicrobium lacus]|uniref:anthranilate phosphoribosyltransferase n=1 Tax=Rhodomicrobium lacus TaxID=2498452 RepID=UPI000F8E9F88|nr:anthranilate phosphoribosyltransferase [Rhodomicrobium lacus]
MTSPATAPVASPADLHAGFRFALEKAATGATLGEEEARAAFLAIMHGAVSEIELAAFLAALKARGETVDEIAGAVAAMRSLMVPVEAPEGALDVVGTGGDAKGTFNISTATAFVLAGAGVPVAKHGNRAVSSKSGAADVLEKLGVTLKMPVERHARCFERAGLTFLWAPTHHPAMRHAAPVRAALKLRTIFNLLGPLTNPASAKRMLIGAYSEDWLQPMAEVLRRNGAHHVWAVHGADGMDELSTTGTSRVVELKNGTLSTFDVHPRDAGLPEARLDDLQAGTPEDAAIAMRALLRGKPGPFRDIVLFNAAAAFIVAGRAADLRDGAALAAASIDEGYAEKALDALIAASADTPDAANDDRPNAAVTG